MFLFKLVIRLRECAAHYDSTFGHTSRLLFNCLGFQTFDLFTVAKGQEHKTASASPNCTLF